MSRLVKGRLVAVTLAMLTAGGCASAPSDGPDADAASSSATECVTGVVVSEGMDMAPRTLVRADDGATTELLGVFAGNVRRLTGATVRACGPGRTPEGPLEVTEVEMIAADGMPAALGTLRSVVSGWAIKPLGGGDLVLLSAVPARLEAAEGEVVWVAGPAADDALAVRSFAVLEGWR
jgi:hypothetical protein